MIQSARLHNLLACEQAYQLHRALFPDQDLSQETKILMLDWLRESVLLGSSEASTDLRNLDPILHEATVRLWEKRFCKIDLEHESEVARSEQTLIMLHELLSSLPLDETVANERGNEQIHLSASLGNIDRLRMLLDHGVDIDSRNAKGETALLCACRANKPQAIMFLLEHEASVIPAASGECPLHWLIALEGHPQVEDITRMLIRRGANLEQQHTETENNELTFDVYPHGTPLDWAVSRRCISVVEILVELGADPFNECSQFSAFTRAISAHDWEMVRVLLTSRHATSSKVRAMESTGHGLLLEAIYCYPRYRRLLLHGPEIDRAAVQTVRSLLQAGCDPSCVEKDGSSIMHTLAGFCDSDFIETIMKECDFTMYINAKAGSLDRTPIHQALAARNIEVFKLLILCGADTYVKSFGYTILHLLAVTADEDFAIECLKALKPNSRNDLNSVVRREGWSDGLTAFELAVHSSHLKIAECLRASGAETAGRPLQDWHFSRLLISHPGWNSLQALQYYLDKVESPFIVREATAHSVLHVAASMMHFFADSITGEQKLDVLLNRFPRHEQVNAITRSSHDLDITGGQTALHLAAKSGAFYAVRKLLRAGASPSVKNEDGDTPLDLARKQLARFRQVIMEHEVFRVTEELKSVVDLLEQPQSLRFEPSIDINITEAQMQTRFSMLGFQTEPLSCSG